MDAFAHVAGLRTVEKAEEPELAARLGARETPTVVAVRDGRVADAAVGAPACLKLLHRLALR